MDCSTGFPVLHYLSEFAQVHVPWGSDAIQPSHPLSSPSPPAFHLSQHRGLSQWVGSSRQVAKVWELQLQHHHPTRSPNNFEFSFSLRNLWFPKKPELFLESLISTRMSSIPVQIHVISHTDYSDPHWKWLCNHPFSSQRNLSHDLIVSPFCVKTSDTLYDVYTQGHIPFLTCHSKPPTIWPRHNFLKSCPAGSYYVSALSPNWTIHMLNKHICFLPSGLCWCFSWGSSHLHL